MLTEAFNSRLLSPRQTLLGATGASLENMIVDPLITGSVCFVVAENAFYRLNKASTTAPSGIDVIATSRGAGVPGRWFRMSSEGEAIYPLSNVYFVDADTTTPLADQDGKVTSPFSTLAQFMAVPGSKVGYFTPNAVSYGDIVHGSGVAISIIGMTVPGVPTALFGDVTLTGNSLLGLEHVTTGEISVDVATLRMESSIYESLTGVPGSTISIDLVTLSASRQAGAVPPLVTNMFVMDAPSVIVDFAVPILAAGEIGNVSLAVTGSEPGDGFVLEPRADDSAWPANVVVGAPRCEVAGTVIVPVQAGVGGQAAATCSMKVIRLSVATT